MTETPLETTPAEPATKPHERDDESQSAAMLSPPASDRPADPVVTDARDELLRLTHQLRATRDPRLLRKLLRLRDNRC